jgi:hypothetical protein
MAARKTFVYEHKHHKKKTRQGCSNKSKGMKKYRGQGGPRKRVKLQKK